MKQLLIANTVVVLFALSSYATWFAINHISVDQPTWAILIGFGAFGAFLSSMSAHYAIEQWKP